MAEEKLYSHALTTVDRAKQRLGIDSTKLDVVLIRIINGVTDFIEQHCHRSFKEQVFTNEIHVMERPEMMFVFLKNRPVSILSSFQYRAGTPSNPSWTNFTADQYELWKDGKSGIIKIYGGLSRNMWVRATYTAGYKIDFKNFGDTALHNLPADLSELADRLVTRILKRREDEGKSQVTFQNSSVNYEKALNPEDKEVLENYTTPQMF